MAEFGLSLPNRAVLFGLAPSALVELAEQAEREGQFDSVWVGDNFLSKPRLESIVLLSALAARTSRVRLGTVCLASFALRHPVQLAIQWASLDRLAEGRTILAVCSGAPASSSPAYAAELAAFGVASRERVARVEEGIEVLRRCWGEGDSSYRGTVHDFRLGAVAVEPKPAQERVPIVIAVNPPVGGDPAVEERALRRVARLADGWQATILEPKLFRERWERIQEYAEEYDRRDALQHSSYHLMVNVDDDPEAARREAVEFLVRYYGERYITDERLASWLAYGSPADVAETIAAYVDAGCGVPILRFASLDQAGQLARCSEEVLPLLGSR